MKFYYLVWFIITVVIAHEGFSGEFSSPTVYDMFKWVAWLFLTAILLLAVRRNKL